MCGYCQLKVLRKYSPASQQMSLRMMCKSAFSAFISSTYFLKLTNAWWKRRAVEEQINNNETMMQQTKMLWNKQNTIVSLTYCFVYIVFRWAQCDRSWLTNANYVRSGNNNHGSMILTIKSLVSCQFLHLFPFVESIQYFEDFTC